MTKEAGLFTGRPLFFTTDKRLSVFAFATPDRLSEFVLYSRRSPGNVLVRAYAGFSVMFKSNLVIKGRREGEIAAEVKVSGDT